MNYEIDLSIPLMSLDKFTSVINWTGNSSPPYYNIYEYEYNDSFLRQVLHLKSIEPIDSIGAPINSLKEIQKKVY